MDLFSSALQKAQASIDKSLGIDEQLANDAMGTRAPVVRPARAIARVCMCVRAARRGYLLAPAATRVWSELLRNARGVLQRPPGPRATSCLSSRAGRAPKSSCRRPAS